MQKYFYIFMIGKFGEWNISLFQWIVITINLLITINKKCINIFWFIYSDYVCNHITMIKWHFACRICFVNIHKSLFNFAGNWFFKMKNVKYEKDNIIHKYTLSTIIWSISSYYCIFKWFYLLFHLG
jgi:hypothetical protein